MTSHPFSEERAETERLRKRPSARRQIKRRGILPSFGDIILPIVSLAAVGLLIIAGRQFFINGIKSSPDITSTRAYADSPALTAERERAKEISEKISEPKTQSLPEPEKSKDEIILAEVAPPIDSVPVITPKNNAPAQTVIQATPTQTQTHTQTQTQPKTVKTPPLPMNKQWRVQTGAYTMKSLAQDAAKKINKAGYKAIVYQNPASKHFKVWVEGGPTKSSAEKVANAMKGLGYKGSFVFPPAK